MNVKQPNLYMSSFNGTEEFEQHQSMTSEYNTGTLIEGEQEITVDVTSNDCTTNIDLKRKKVLTEPQKPVSAYALFFRDTQSAIKGQNPDVSFEEVSKIVTSMWDALDPGHKNVYKKKAEAAKREYLRALAAYRSTTSGGAAVRVTDDSSSEQNSSATDSDLNKTTNIVPALKITNEHHETSIQQGNKLPHFDKQQQQQLQQQQQQQQEVSVNRIQQGQDNNEQQNTCTDGSESCQTQQCIREGCTKVAIVNSDWEDEYCSNECVITHCRNVFTQWVHANSLSADSFSTT